MSISRARRPAFFRKHDELLALGIELVFTTP
jgi:hypothetical protein